MQIIAAQNAEPERLGAEFWAEMETAIAASGAVQVLGALVYLEVLELAALVDA